jgi:CHAD domain-containing protein
MTSPARQARDPGTADDGRPAVALWPEAGAAALTRFTEELEHRAKDIGNKVEPYPVHDMRTATRRMRTTATIYRSVFPNRDLRRLEDELKRVAHRLGAMRDLDVMLGMLGEPGEDGGSEADGTEPLRRAWTKERDHEADRLRSELDRPRFGRSLESAARLAEDARSSVAGGDGAGAHREPTQRVAHRAPSMIWKSFGEVLAYDLDPRTADPDEIHQMRIAAKGFRYTLEAFEDAVGRGLKSLIEEVTALQDAAGEMHDAIVAAERARELIRSDGLEGAELEAIERFANEQDARAEALRPDIHRRFETVRSPAFRRSLGNAMVTLAGKGVRPALI